MIAHVRRTAWPIALAACIIAAALAIARIWSHHAGEMRVSEVDWGFAALAFGLYAAFVLIYASGWCMLVQALQTAPVPFGRGMRLFLLSWPGRYVPGSIAYYGGRMASARSIGANRSTVAVSMVYENVFAVAASGLLSVALLGAGFGRALDMNAWLVGVLAAMLVATSALHPAVARTAVRVAARRVRRLRPLEQNLLSSGQTVGVGLVYVAGSICSGVAYYAALRALSLHPPLLLAVAAYSIGGVAGMIALFVPGGVGVREGVAAGVVSAAVAGPAALSAAVLLRLVSVAADLALPAAVLALAGAASLLRRQAGIVLAPEKDRAA